MRQSIEDPEVAGARERVLEAARRWLFREGYQALNMDQLARDLGMSKKTLYVHFAGKEALVDELINGFAADMKAMAEEVFGDRRLSYTAKLARFTRELTGRFGALPPGFFRELQRYAPRVYRRIEELRFRNIPVVFGRLIEEGQRVGKVRKSVDPAFATEFWRHAIQGVIHPDTTERLGLRPDQIFAQALNLFCGGLLTAGGMKDYEKHAIE